MMSSEIGMKANMCFRIEKPHQFNTFQYMRAFCGAILQYALYRRDSTAEDRTTIMKYITLGFFLFGHKLDSVDTMVCPYCLERITFSLSLHVPWDLILNISIRTLLGVSLNWRDYWVVRCKWVMGLFD